MTSKVAGGVTATYAYDKAGRLVAANDDSAAVARPAVAARFTRTAAYDALDRPTATTFSDAPPQATPAAARFTLGHAYDRANRRIGQTTTDSGLWSVPTAAATTSYSANALDQYTSVGGVALAYDSDGNLASDGTLTLGYDAEGRLVSAAAGGMAASYAYGPDGRRKSRTVNGATIHGIGEGLGPDLVEWDAATGQLTARTIPGLGPVGAVARLDPVAGTRASLVPDIQGSTIAALASDAAAPATAGYRPFGEGPGVFAIGYTGQRLDAETGLYAMNARAYHPGLGRFVQADPAGRVDGLNLYAYVRNDPLNAVDPSGLYWFRQEWQTEYVVGRVGSPVEPGGRVSRFIENYVPAGRTFGDMHDGFVDAAVDAGLPDLLVNIPSMPFLFVAAVEAEIMRTAGILDQPAAPQTPSQPVDRRPSPDPWQASFFDQSAISDRSESRK